MTVRSLFKYSILLIVFCVNCDLPSYAQSLDSLFKNPPLTAKPYVWWHWMGSNFSKAGITKDLEAMKAQGIGGATIFNITSAVQESHAPTLNNPWPTQTYRSPAYWDAMKFAASEASRLGIEIGLHNSAGYSTTGGPWIDESRGMKKLVWSKAVIYDSSPTLITIKKPDSIASNGWGSRVLAPVFSTWYKDIAYLAIPLADSVRFTKYQDFTSYFDLNGKQQKKLPKGDWLVYRLGYAATMSIPHPLPDDIMGRTFEADKMSEEQSVYHWNQVLNPFKEYLDKYLGGSFKHMLIDSYEAGYQNWTPNFREEFISQKGYDPLPWVLTFSDVITKEFKPDMINGNKRIRFDQEQTKRFEWDYKDVMNKLYFEKGWEIGKKALHDVGLTLQWEPYGGPFDTSEGAALADLPMAEFWSDGKGTINATVPAAARAAGKTVVGAEAFTGRPGVSQYTEDPASLKASAINAFASGINRLILHHWVHQPFDDKYQPGMGMGWWGTHFGRNQTWAEPGKAFFQFLSRTQVLLQYGQTLSDYVCVEQLQGEADLISKNDFLKQKIKVVNGKVVLESGRIYPFIVFPTRNTMLPEVLDKIKLLIDQGASIVATKPIASPSLMNFLSADSGIVKLSDKLWTNKNMYGTLNEAKEHFMFVQDFKVEQADSTKYIKIIHRTGASGEVYYVANTYRKSQQVTLSFNQKDVQPELWQPENGKIMNAPVWRVENGRTYIQLNLADFESVFLIFRKSIISNDHPTAVKIIEGNGELAFNLENNNQYSLSSTGSVKVAVEYALSKAKVYNFKPAIYIPIEGTWKATMNPKLAAPFVVDFPVLKDFSLHEDERVNYFAGTAIYKKEIVLNTANLNDKHVMLDLGTVNDIVSIKLNGKDLGVLWYPPYRIDVTHVLKAGANALEISVTTNWANRLIGDEQEPADFEWGTDRAEKGRAMKAYPDWFIKNERRPSTGRKTFSVWYYYRKDSKLVPAGLVGPVRFIVQDKVNLN